MTSLNLGLPDDHDRHSLKARRAGKCAECGMAYEKGEEVLPCRRGWLALAEAADPDGWQFPRRPFARRYRHLNCEQKGGPEPIPPDRLLRATSDWPNAERELGDFVPDATSDCDRSPRRLPIPGACRFPHPEIITRPNHRPMAGPRVSRQQPM